MHSILGVKFDFILVLRSQFFEFLRETLYKHALEHLEAAGLPTVNAHLLLTSLKVCDWSGHIFGASASPRSLTKKLAMSPSSTVHGGQDDTEVVTFVLLSHEAFVADKIWGFTLERARSNVPGAVFVNRFPPILCESRVFAIDHQFRLS